MKDQQYQVTKDGASLFIGTEKRCWAWMHLHQSGSVARALKHEGYDIQPVTEPETSADPKHTPGPWKWYKSNADNGYGNGKGTFNALEPAPCDDSGPSVLTWATNSENARVEIQCSEANAQLIAAAPELLTACDYTITKLDDMMVLLHRMKSLSPIDQLDHIGQVECLAFNTLTQSQDAVKSAEGTG